VLQSASSSIPLDHLPYAPRYQALKHLLQYVILQQLKGYVFFNDGLTLELVEVVLVEMKSGAFPDDREIVATEAGG
jgi:hypothetical protein